MIGWGEVGEGAESVSGCIRFCFVKLIDYTWLIFFD